MPIPQFTLAAQTGRVPSMRVPLDHAQELRFERLMEDLVLIDVHQHPMVLAADANEMPAYFRGNAYAWGFDAVKAGAWTTVATANLLSCLGKEPDASFSRFGDLVDEIGMMLADVHKQAEQVVKVTRTQDILDARQCHKMGFLPTVEHLSIGNELHHVDVLYGIGVRLAGLTYMRKSSIGDGQYERTDCGLSDFGVEVVQRMNDIGMIIDLSHAGSRTALEAIELSEVPVVFSHNAAATIRPTRRARSDEELLACAHKGGLLCVTAVPNSLSEDPHQDINCVLDHYDYFVKLAGVDHVGIGTDTQVGDHVGFHRVLLGRNAPDSLPADYLDGLESPADGSNIIRGLISRGYEDDAIRKIAGLNALDFFPAHDGLMGMAYTVFGAGAIGGTVGAHMVRGGESVLFVDRDADHVRAMQERGLTIRGFDETFTVRVEATTPDVLPDRLETVLLACKAPATEAAVESFKDRLAPDGCVVSLQNGLNELQIARIVGEERTMGAFVNFSADYLEPGLIHFGGRGAFYIGELDGSLTPRVRQLRDGLGHWGNVQVTDNIWGFLWGKQAYGAMLFATALTNDSMGDAIDQHRAVIVELAREVLSVADALGRTPLGFDGFEPEAIGSSDRARVDASLERLIAVRRGDEKTHSGVWRDMAVRKRRTEVDAHFGPIVKDAHKHGLDVPLLEGMIAMIHEVEDGRRPFSGANLDELDKLHRTHIAA